MTRDELTTLAIFIHCSVTFYYARVAGNLSPKIAIFSKVNTVKQPNGL